MRALLRGVRSSLELLLGRRLWLFAAIDAAVVLAALFQMLLGDGGEPAGIYTWVVLLPFLLLGLPALSGIVEVERRAGCLDLALSAPGAVGYFVRRAAAVCGLMAVQGWLLTLLDWLYEERGFPLLAPLAQIAAVTFLLGALALFWAVHLKTAGAVWLASMATLVLLRPWFFSNPLGDLYFSQFGPWLPGRDEALPWLGGLAVLGTAATLLSLYARRRLRRPESML
ncbi:MAG TPA: hypothetical protein DD490_29005 [Acidobacteria bacterium]|nr:hypothetical protein [Acidobacteriota bacterium]